MVVAVLAVASCQKEQARFTQADRRTADSIVRQVHATDSLASLQKRLEGNGDRLGSIVALREWGKALRNESRFDEALSCHMEGLRQSDAAGDTLEMVMALNNIGTDYRRMGVLDVAQDYHYRAWKTSEEHSDTSLTARKNRVMSLNGLGNIYMTMGNYERADSLLRMALKGEEALGSALGQAINWANLGFIFSSREQNDSAWEYYRRSMVLNREAGSTLGVALSHINFGQLYEKGGAYERASEEYEAAYELMKASKDEWHALNSLTALAGIAHKMGREARAIDILAKAQGMAEKIRSNEHLADIHTLYYHIFERQGDYRQALDHHVKAMALKDSVMDREMMNRINNVSMNIERGWQEKQMSQMYHELKEERTSRYVSYGIFALVTLLLLATLVMLLYTLRTRARSHRVLKQMSNLRETFFTNITHEFRTPLTVILGLSQNIAEGDRSDALSRERAQVIMRQGNRLLTLINQLLDISKIKSAVGEPEWRNGDVAAYISMIVESYRDYADGRGIVLKFFAVDSVNADFVPDYINKIMNNLISNALKFTPKYGQVAVRVKEEDNQLVVEVSDTGIGIPQENLEDIFSLFYQAGSNAHNFGTGVGLALVRQIVDDVGGSIHVESTVGSGTTFLLRLPLRHGTTALASFDAAGTDNMPMILDSETTRADSRGRPNGIQVLIIEDNRDVADYIGSSFPAQYGVSYAYNGEQGVEKAKAMVPDVVITDLMMPGVDGLEVCRQIRSDVITNHIPIILLTAKQADEDRIKAYEVGADAYIAKPFNSTELLVRVGNLLEQRRRLRDKYEYIVVGDGTKQTDKADDANRRFLIKMVDIIHSELDKGHEVNVALVASAMCMSSRQFYRKTNALTGYTPVAYIQRVKIGKAQQLLKKNTHIGFSAVASQCGFSDYSNFVRAFKNVVGMTPRQYVNGNV